MIVEATVAASIELRKSEAIRKCTLKERILYSRVDHPEESSMMLHLQIILGSFHYEFQGKKIRTYIPIVTFSLLVVQTY